MAIAEVKESFPWSHEQLMKAIYHSNYWPPEMSLSDACKGCSQNDNLLPMAEQCLELTEDDQEASQTTQQYKKSRRG